MLVSSSTWPASTSHDAACWPTAGKNGPPVAAVSCDAFTVLSTPMLTVAPHDVIEYAASITNRPRNVATDTVRPGRFDSSENTGAASNPTYAVMVTASAARSYGPFNALHDHGSKLTEPPSGWLRKMTS